MSLSLWDKLPREINEYIILLRNTEAVRFIQLFWLRRFKSIHRWTCIIMKCMLEIKNLQNINYDEISEKYNKYFFTYLKIPQHIKIVKKNNIKNTLTENIINKHDINVVFTAQALKKIVNQNILDSAIYRISVISTYDSII